MQKAQYERIRRNLITAIKQQAPLDPQGKPISKSELQHAGREFRVAAKKWARILANRKRINEKAMTYYTTGH